MVEERERILMLFGRSLRWVSGAIWVWRVAAIKGFVMRRVEIVWAGVVAMEAFQHLKRSTVFWKPVACERILE
jgi:hypothetical protein